MAERDLQRHYLVLSWTAIGLTVVASALLGFAIIDFCATDKVVKESVIERVRARTREVFFDEDKADAANSFEKCCGELRAALAAERRVREPEGFFTWRAKPGIEFDQNVPREVQDAVGRLKTMGDWDQGPKSRKKPKMSDQREFAGHQVVWVRDGKRNGRVCGVVFAEDPIAPDLAKWGMWVAIGAIFMATLGVLIGEARRLKKKGEAARKDSETKSTFLSNASHELKTPLAGIGLWAEMLQMGSLKGEKIQQAYDIIVNENARMQRLVGNLLDYSRLEQGRRRYSYMKVDLALLAEDVVDLVRGDFAEHGVSVRAEAKAVAWADLDAAKQILVNLLGNAAKYASAGGPVEVVVSDGGERVQVSVLDRGPGMSETERKHAFERFWRGDDKLTATVGGLGLGLSISDSLAKDMDGCLSVDAREGGGCVFTLALPSA